MQHFVAAGKAGGLDWQTGTKWRGGMTPGEISQAEARFGLRFPPDYRLFLETLHTPDPPLVGASYQASRIVPHTGREFPDWTGDPAPIIDRLAWPLDGLLASDPWYPTWGPSPETKAEREGVIHDLVAAGPQLVPVFGHRYLVGPPERAGNPVISIYGADVIVYAWDLRSYLLSEFSFVPRGDQVLGRPTAPEWIPFWQDVIDCLDYWP
jgi:hypothetical protein